MCYKLITFFVSCLLLCLCVPCVLASDVYSVDIDTAPLEFAAENDLGQITPYADGSDFTISVSGIGSKPVASILFSDSNGSKITFKNIPVTPSSGSSGGWAGTGSIDFNALAGSDSAWTSTLITQLMAKLDVMNSYLGTATSNSALSHLTSIDSSLLQEGLSVAYWVRQNQLATASLQQYLALGIPALDGHLFSTSGNGTTYYVNPAESLNLIRLRYSNADISTLLSAISLNTATSTQLAYIRQGTPILGDKGDVVSAGIDYGLADVVRYGFIGLRFRDGLFSRWLSGSDSFTPSFSLDLVKEYDEDGNPVTETVQYSSFADFLGGFGNSLITPVTMLRDVLATPEDIRLREQEAENKKEFTDNFTGDGDAAAGLDDISGAAGFTSGIKDAFGDNTVSAADVFKPMTDEETFAFFSQSTHDALDTTSGVSALSDDDDFWDQFEVDEDGFYHVKDQSPWSIFDYLGKED